METIYNVDYFIKKFENIPGDKWHVGTYKNGDRMCAQGHCISWQNDGSGLGNNTDEVRQLRFLLPNVGHINNGNDFDYQQPTPKQRILQALYDIKAKQQPAEPKEKIIYRTVVIDSAVKELQETLTQN